ncbi:CPBP family intramembrane glutamic endopeptidase [Agarilytica rhodophyticola]|uniref:CPBP family intramembrane glutamic endopeptidase n=1 Tax=Agarilytica rhodophyticola TaxID=1737490 RepID=UPI000B34579B
MDMANWLHPRNILIALDDIDNETSSYTLNRQQALRQVFYTMASVAVCLLIIHYMKYDSTFQATLALLSSIQGQTTHYWSGKIQATGYGHLIGYCWWTFWHVIGYVLIPCIVIKKVLSASIVDMGWRWNDTSTHWRGYLLLLSPILVFIIMVSQGEDFINHYPFYKQAGRSWFDLLAWEFLYLLQFICLEFFFRGYFVNALRPAIGANAIWVMCLPYLMIHFPKLWLEATGAILFGLFLGILALRSRSIWGGFLVHAGVAVSMDIASLIKQGKIPTVFWP